ncbi:MAG: hypothetical protein P4L55_21935 [Syntrophobacteraceae bacterium]|nr:hypothetical protein [Syntrophobacteraceae bacterium]
MKPFLFAFLLLTNILFNWHPALAAYQPMGTWTYGSIAAFDEWESLRQIVSAPIADGNRPVLPGVNGRNLELLQDALARKYHRATQGKQLPIARRVLAGISTSTAKGSSFPKIRGYMAEAIFLDKNPDYGYIGKVNASQHDVYMKNPAGGRGIITGQVKVVMDGNPGKYAARMIDDRRAKHFFVPDDHVDSLRAYLKQKADRLRREGKLGEAIGRYRDMNRVQPIGATSAQIDSATRQALREARFTRAAPYVFLGAAAMLTIGPIAWEWYTGDINTSGAAAKVARGGATLLPGIVVDRALVYYRGGILRGTMGGNALTAAVMLVTDTAWQVYEFGGFDNAVQNPDFIMRFGGDVGATTLGLLGGTLGAEGGAAVGSFAGPVGTTIGGVLGGIIAGTGSGVIGYWGGHEGTRWMLKEFAPNVLYEEENRYIEVVLNNIEKDIGETEGPTTPNRRHYSRPGPHGERHVNGQAGNSI